MNLIQQAVARADQLERERKPVISPLEPMPNLGSIHPSRSFRPVPLNPSRTPLAAIGMALLALAGGAGLYVALVHSRDEAAVVASALEKFTGGNPPAPAPAAAPPAVAAVQSPPAPAPATATAAVAVTPAAAPAIPTPPVAAPAAAPADLLLEARVTIDAWAQSWSQRDVSAYLAFYGKGFVPERGVSRAAWEKARRAAIERRSRILVTVNNLQLESTAPDRLVASYTQDYAADTYRETGTPKRLELAREGATWRIVAESAAAAAPR